MFFCLCCNLTQAPFSSSGPGSFRLRPGRPGRRCLQPGGRPPPEAALAGRPGPQRDSKQSPKQQRLSLSRDFPKRNTGAAPRASPSCRGPPGPVLPKPSLSLSPSAWPKSSHLLQAEHRMCVESCSATSTFPKKGKGRFPLARTCCGFAWRLGDLEAPGAKGAGAPCYSSGRDHRITSRRTSMSSMSAL